MKSYNVLLVVATLAHQGLSVKPTTEAHATTSEAPHPNADPVLPPHLDPFKPDFTTRAPHPEFFPVPTRDAAGNLVKPPPFTDCSHLHAMGYVPTTFTTYGRTYTVMTPTATLKQFTEDFTTQTTTIKGQVMTTTMAVGTDATFPTMGFTLDEILADEFAAFADEFTRTHTFTSIPTQATDRVAKETTLTKTTKRSLKETPTTGSS